MWAGLNDSSNEQKLADIMECGFLLGHLVPSKASYRVVSGLMERPTHGKELVALMDSQQGTEACLKADLAVGP